MGLQLVRFLCIKNSIANSTLIIRHVLLTFEYMDIYIACPQFVALKYNHHALKVEFLSII